MAALFLSVAVGYWIGKLKIGNFSLGGMAGTLLVAVVIGQVGVPVDPVIKDMMFALFIYATGYVSGPQFFASLNRKTISQLHLAIISVSTIFVFIFVGAPTMQCVSCKCGNFLVAMVGSICTWRDCNPR